MITGGNEASIAKLIALLFVMNGTFITFLGVPIIRFLAIEKMVPALALNFIILLLHQMLEEVRGTGMLWAFLITFFTQLPFFF